MMASAHDHSQCFRQIHIPHGSKKGICRLDCEHLSMDIAYRIECGELKIDLQKPRLKKIVHENQTATFQIQTIRNDGKYKNNAADHVSPISTVCDNMIRGEIRRKKHLNRKANENITYQRTHVFQNSENNVFSHSTRSIKSSRVSELSPDFTRGTTQLQTVQQDSNAPYIGRMAGHRTKLWNSEIGLRRSEKCVDRPVQTFSSTNIESRKSITIKKLTQKINKIGDIAKTTNKAVSSLGVSTIYEKNNRNALYELKVKQNKANQTELLKDALNNKCNPNAEQVDRNNENLDDKLNTSTSVEIDKSGANRNVKPKQANDIIKEAVDSLPYLRDTDVFRNNILNINKENIGLENKSAVFTSDKVTADSWDETEIFEKELLTLVNKGTEYEQHIPTNDKLSLALLNKNLNKSYTGIEPTPLPIASVANLKPNSDNFYKKKSGNHKNKHTIEAVCRKLNTEICADNKSNECVLKDGNLNQTMKPFNGNNLEEVFDTEGNLLHLNTQHQNQDSISINLHIPNTDISSNSKKIIKKVDKKNQTSRSMFKDKHSNTTTKSINENHPNIDCDTSLVEKHSLHTLPYLPQDTLRNDPKVRKDKHSNTTTKVINENHPNIDCDTSLVEKHSLHTLACLPQNTLRNDPKVRKDKHSNTTTKVINENHPNIDCDTSLVEKHSLHTLAYLPQDTFRNDPKVRKDKHSNSTTKSINENHPNIDRDISLVEKHSLQTLAYLPQDTFRNDPKVRKDKHSNTTTKSINENHPNIDRDISSVEKHSLHALQYLPQDTLHNDPNTPQDVESQSRSREYEIIDTETNRRSKSFDKRKMRGDKTGNRKSDSKECFAEEMKKSQDEPEAPPETTLPSVKLPDEDAKVTDPKRKSKINSFKRLLNAKTKTLSKDYTVQRVAVELTDKELSNNIKKTAENNIKYWMDESEKTFLKSYQHSKVAVYKHNKTSANPVKNVIIMQCINPDGIHQATTGKNLSIVKESSIISANQSSNHSHQLTQMNNSKVLECEGFKIVVHEDTESHESKVFIIPNENSMLKHYQKVMMRKNILKRVEGNLSNIGVKPICAFVSVPVKYISLNEDKNPSITADTLDNFTSRSCIKTIDLKSQNAKYKPPITSKWIQPEVKSLQINTTLKQKHVAFNDLKTKYTPNARNKKCPTSLRTDRHISNICEYVPGPIDFRCKPSRRKKDLSPGIVKSNLADYKTDEKSDIRKSNVVGLSAFDFDGNDSIPHKNDRTDAFIDSTIDNTKKIVIDKGSENIEKTSYKSKLKDNILESSLDSMTDSSSKSFTTSSKDVGIQKDPCSPYVSYSENSIQVHESQLTPDEKVSSKEGSSSSSYFERYSDYAFPKTHTKTKDTGCTMQDKIIGKRLTRDVREKYSVLSIEHLELLKSVIYLNCDQFDIDQSNIQTPDLVSEADIQDSGFANAGEDINTKLMDTLKLPEEVVKQTPVDALPLSESLQDITTNALGIIKIPETVEEKMPVVDVTVKVLSPTSQLHGDTKCNKSKQRRKCSFKMFKLYRSPSLIVDISRNNGVMDIPIQSRNRTHTEIEVLKVQKSDTDLRLHMEDHATNINYKDRFEITHETNLFSFLVWLGFSPEDAEAINKDQSLLNELNTALEKVRLLSTHISLSQGALIYIIMMKLKERPNIARFLSPLLDAIVKNRITSVITLEGFIKLLECIENGRLAQPRDLGFKEIRDETAYKNKYQRKQLLKIFIKLCETAQFEVLMIK